MIEKNIPLLFNKVIDIYKKYSLVHRRVVSVDKFFFLNESNALVKISPEQKNVAETLLEHVGVLPIVATFLYPHLENRDKIDLGKVLVMLAIHDIGETVVGDKHPHRKTEKEIIQEQSEAKKILGEVYFESYDEFEAGKSLDAKFAKAVDVFSTFLSDQILPAQLVNERLELYDFSWQVFEEKRRINFEWDLFLSNMFDEVIVRYKLISENIK